MSFLKIVIPKTDSMQILTFTKVHSNNLWNSQQWNFLTNKYVVVHSFQIIISCTENTLKEQLRVFYSLIIHVGSSNCIIASLSLEKCAMNRLIW